MKLLNGASFQRLDSALQAAEMRQRIISNNVANADTPHFKRSELVFEELLAQEMGTIGESQLAGKRTHTKHLEIGKSSNFINPQVITDEQTQLNNYENNVDIDREMALLAKNQLRYNFYVQQVNHDVHMMRTAIEGRG